MIFRTTTLFGLLLLTVSVAPFAFGQEKLTHKPRLAGKDSSAPVTQSEARATFLKVQTSLSSVSQKPMTFAPSTIPESSKPVTREQVIAEFDRLYKGAKPYFKMTPRPVYYDPTLLTFKAGTPTRAMLENLIKEGAVAKVGVIATSKQDTLSVFDFGDGVGIFIARIADLCHMPSPKFSPNIEQP